MRRGYTPVPQWLLVVPEATLRKMVAVELIEAARMTRQAGLEPD